TVVTSFIDLTGIAGDAELKQRFASDLEEARQRTHRLLGPLDDERLTTQFDPVMSPPVWDYAHIAAFEELWLVQRLSGAPPMLHGGYLDALPSPPAGRSVDPDMVTVPGGRYPLGSDMHEPYDNEHPCHEVDLAAFRIDRFPVTNGDLLAFMADGGYTRQELWS